jgi:hypothetical protein
MEPAADPEPDVDRNPRPRKERVPRAKRDHYAEFKGRLIFDEEFRQAMRTRRAPQRARGERPLALASQRGRVLNLVDLQEPEPPRAAAMPPSYTIHIV